MKYAFKQRQLRKHEMTASELIKSKIRNKSVDIVLKRLEPYKPKKLILGNHFIPELSKDFYNGIPVEISQNEFELDFEV